MKAMYAAVRIRTLERPLYIYNTTPGSVRYRDRHIYDFVEAWTRTYQWLEEHGSPGNVEQAKAFVNQKSPEKFVKYAKREGWKIRAGRMLLKIGAVRRMRDRRRFPVKINE